MVVSWKSLTGSVVSPNSSVLVDLGKNSVQGYGDIAWDLLSGFAKVFAIPLTLAIIGFSLNERAKKHQEQTEKEREARRQELEQTRSLRAETWKQMLPVCHEYAAKYYLPLSTASQRLAECLSQSNNSLTFFYLINLTRIMAETRHAIGGFYFKDLRGEVLAAECWKRSTRALLGATDDSLHRAVHACVVLLDAGENYGTFVQKFGMSSALPTSFKNSQVDHAWRLFVQRLSDKSLVEQAALHLRAFCGVIDFEVGTNLPLGCRSVKRLRTS